MVLPIVFQGGKEVLHLMGFSETRPDAVAFPDDVEEPDHNLVRYS